MQQLQLKPLPGACTYRAAVTWESYANGEYQVLTLHKEIALQLEPNVAGYVLDFWVAPPQLAQPLDPEPLAALALQLATLYEWVQVQALPTGELGALLNHDAVCQAWDELAQEVRATTIPEDQVTHTILDFLQRQVQSPTSFLDSLMHDYVYQALVPAWYGQPLSSTSPLVRTRGFSNFFDKITLWFTEQVAVVPTEMPGQLVLHCSGALDGHQTDGAAVQAAIERALRLAQVPVGQPALPATLPTPHFLYEARHVLDAVTGLPLQVELTVYARAGQLFNKEYTLSINCL